MAEIQIRYWVPTGSFATFWQYIYNLIIESNGTYRHVFIAKESKALALKQLSQMLEVDVVKCDFISRHWPINVENVSMKRRS
jgi:hypothetical protein